MADVSIVNATEPVSPAIHPQREKATAVKWDEGDIVDAVIIGDAIESFLKGSMSDSKRVSFKRHHSDRKTKSDG